MATKVKTVDEVVDVPHPELLSPEWFRQFTTPASSAGGFAPLSVVIPNPHTKQHVVLPLLVLKLYMTDILKASAKAAFQKLT